MSWDKEYNRHKRLWGEGPSELGKAAASYLQKRGPITWWDILDIGCGYGRDSFHLAGELQCKVTGIDVSKKALEIAGSAAAERGTRAVAFRRLDFRELNSETYDALFASNLYQLLNQPGRSEFREAVKRALKSNGILFLSTLSISDPEHYGKGAAIADEPNSFLDQKFLHLCTKEELTHDFRFLQIEELYEQKYDEPRATGEVHHHVSWILIARMPESEAEKRHEAVP